LEQVACGEIGLTINYFYSLTPREFNNILIGYRQKEEALTKERWKHTQQVIFYAALNFDSKDKNITPDKFFPLPWEQELKIEKLKPKKTPEQIKKEFEHIDKSLKNNAS